MSSLVSSAAGAAADDACRAPASQRWRLTSRRAPSRPRAPGPPTNHGFFAPPRAPASPSPAAALLCHSDPLLLPAVLQLRPLIGGLLGHLASDPPAVSLAALRLLESRALGARSPAPPRAQGGAWGDAALGQLAVMCRAGEGGASGGADAAGGARGGSEAEEGAEGDGELLAPHQLLPDTVGGGGGSSSGGDGGSDDGSGDGGSSSSAGSSEGEDEDEGSGGGEGGLDKPEAAAEPRRAPLPARANGAAAGPAGGGKGAAAAAAAAETEAAAAAAAYDLLLRLLTNPAYGLASDHPAHIAAGAEVSLAAAPTGADRAGGLAPGERRLLRLLQRLQPGSSARHAALVRAAAAAQPRLAEKLLAALPYDLEPRPDARWLASAAAAGALVRGAARVPCALGARLAAPGGAPPGADSAAVRGTLRRCLPAAVSKVRA